ncbi:MAG TPA: hypothetical protein VFP81_08720 [Propionibacteriaceae bacterium]|nr:hypothetical protein [Propionibacteriaceae bacterium]
MRPLAQLRIARCQVAPTIARARAKHRRGEQPSRAAHDDIGHFSVDRSYEPIRLDAPTLDVDTLTGYRPDLDAIAAFASSP